METKILKEVVSSLGQVVDSVRKSEKILMSGDSLMGLAEVQKARVCLIDALVMLSDGIPEGDNLRNQISLIIRKFA